MLAAKRGANLANAKTKCINAAVHCVTFRANLGHVKIRICTKASNRRGRWWEREETWGQYGESKISVFFLSGETSALRLLAAAELLVFCRHS